MNIDELYLEIRNDFNHPLFEKLFFLNENNQPIFKPNMAIQLLNGIPYVYDTNPFESSLFSKLTENVQTLSATNQPSPFTSKGYPFKKDLAQYDSYHLGRAFFSDGVVQNNGRFELFDHINLFQDPWLKGDSLFYNKYEIPVNIYTSDNPEEIEDKYNKITLEDDEIAVFLCKQENNIKVNVALGNALLKLSNFNSKDELKNKEWDFSQEEINTIKNNFSGKELINFLNKNNEIFNDELEDIGGLTFKKKTKVHFTIGMFFDGTGNNRFNSEKNYYEKINKDNIVYANIPKNKKLKNGTVIQSDDSYWNPYSNVVLLHDLYEDSNFKSTDKFATQTLKIYIQGIGTLKDSDDDVKGSGFGEGERGIISKVNDGCKELAIQIKKTLGNKYEIGSLTFDVFGFSRGAAAARHFCNEILGAETIKPAIQKGKVVRDGKNKIIGQYKDDNIGKDYFLGLLGENLKEEKTQSKIRVLKNESNKVNIRFVGLFDTVVGQFIVQDHLGKKIDLALATIPATRILTGLGTYIETKLDNVKQKIDNLPIQKIVHFVAKDEWRENFSITKTKKNKNISEIELPGAHSDIGGGYAATKTDEDILDYDYSSYEGFTEKNIIPKRLETLKKLYINKGYCTTEQISIVPTGVEKRASNVGYNFIENYKLISNRNIIPRYSIVNMYAMRDLAKLFKVPFNKNINEAKFRFEYTTPKELIDYQTELIEKLKLDIQNKKSKPQKFGVNKNKFIHLSANFNASKGIEKKGEPILGIKDLDKLLYINHPNYSNDEETSYVRKIYTHNK